MAFYTYTTNPVGVFVEKEVGNYFEYSHNDETVMEDFPHKVWVGGADVCGMRGWRYANVKKTVAYIVTDEDDFGQPVVQKWNITKHKEYA